MPLQRLKPDLVSCFFGTTEVMPCYKAHRFGSFFAAFEALHDLAEFTYKLEPVPSMQTRVLDRSKSRKLFWPSSLSGAAQLDHCFQMKGLGKEVGEGDGLDLVARGDERAQVAGQRGRVAGDVDQRGRGDPASSAVISAPRPVRGGSTTIRSGRRPWWSRRRKSSVVARTGIPPRAFEIGGQRLGCRRGGLDGDTRSKPAVSCRAKRPTPAKRSQASAPSRPAVTRSTSASTSQRLTWKKAPWSTR